MPRNATGLTGLNVHSSGAFASQARANRTGPVLDTPGSSTSRVPLTPSSALTPEQRAERFQAIELGLSGSSQPHPPPTPISARSRSSANGEEAARTNRLALIEEALSPSQVSKNSDAAPSTYRPLHSINTALEKAKSPSPAAGAAASKGVPSSPSKRNYIEVSDDEEEQFWGNKSGDNSPRPHKARRGNDPRPAAENVSKGLQSRASSVTAGTPTPPSTNPDIKSKGKEKETSMLISDPVSRATLRSFLYGLKFF